MNGSELGSIVDDSRSASGGIDRSNGALDNSDVGCAEGRDVGVLDPGLLRVVGVRKGEG